MCFLYDNTLLRLVTRNEKKGILYMFFDIGSNEGQWALANADSTEKIIAVEASPNTFKKLIRNVTGNPKIICENYAVCNNGGQDITFYEAHYDTLSTLNKDWLTSKESRFYNTAFYAITCKTITLDSLIGKYGMPSLIKIDTEGGEYECLSSLNKKVDMVCFEWASEINNSSLKCVDHLMSLGFTQFYLQDGDAYTFRPREFYSVDVLRNILSKTIPKKDWGMIWCK